jgi:hypothetical protein
MMQQIKAFKYTQYIVFLVEKFPAIPALHLFSTRPEAEIQLPSQMSVLQTLKGVFRSLDYGAGSMTSN